MHEGTFFLSVFFECSGGLVRSPGGSPRASCTHKICPPGTPGTPGTPRPQTPMSDLLGTGPTPPSPDVRPPGTAAGRQASMSYLLGTGGTPTGPEVRPPGTTAGRQASRSYLLGTGGTPTALEVRHRGYRRHAHKPRCLTSRGTAVRPQSSRLASRRAAYELASRGTRSRIVRIQWGRGQCPWNRPIFITIYGKFSSLTKS